MIAHKFTRSWLRVLERMSEDPRSRASDSSSVFKQALAQLSAPFFRSSLMHTVAWQVLVGEQQRPYGAHRCVREQLASRSGSDRKRLTGAAPGIGRASSWLALSVASSSGDHERDVPTWTPCGFSAVMSFAFVHLTRSASYCMELYDGAFITNRHILRVLPRAFILLPPISYASLSWFGHGRSGAVAAIAVMVMSQAPGRPHSRRRQHMGYNYLCSFMSPA